MQYEQNKLWALPHHGHKTLSEARSTNTSQCTQSEELAPRMSMSTTANTKGRNISCKKAPHKGSFFLHSLRLLPGKGENVLKEMETPILLISTSE